MWTTHLHLRGVNISLGMVTLVAVKKKYNGKSKSGGVYQISNLVNGKIYIGSCKCFQVRASQHKSTLYNGKHHNKHLQASWDKHGADAFLFEVVEVIDGDQKSRIAREQFYIDQWLESWETCYNFKKRACSNRQNCSTAMKVEKNILLA